MIAGTVLAVGGEAQVAALDSIQDEGGLGCFALTEKFAGVQSGLVVQTTAEWDPAKKAFLLHTPSPGAQKNWISQVRAFENQSNASAQPCSFERARTSPALFLTHQAWKS